MQGVLRVIGRIVIVTLQTLGGVLGAVGSGGAVPPQRPGQPPTKRHADYRP